MAQMLIALVAGVIFSVGLIVSQMVNPAKVLNFLDVSGDWDPTLAFVMGGALLVTIPAFRLLIRWQKPLFDEQFYMPTKQALDWKLISGAALFGIGWGIAGLCPGPALTALASGLLQVVGFVAAMAAGMLAHKALFER